jgi:hypothetical protein
MIKRLGIAAATALAFIFSVTTGAPVASHQQVGSSSVATTDGCPSPLTMHSDGTCWP